MNSTDQPNDLDPTQNAFYGLPDLPVEQQATFKRIDPAANVGNLRAQDIVEDDAKPTYLGSVTPERLAQLQKIDDVARSLIINLGLKTKLAQDAAFLVAANLTTLDSKQLDYGRQNLDDFGEYGVLVRLNDKLSRLKNLLKSGDEAKHESVRDSWLDAANYALIGLVLHDEEASL